MPRDLRTYRPRLRSPLTSISRSSSQVSISDETPTSVRVQLVAVRQAGEQRRDLLALEEVDQPQ